MGFSKNPFLDPYDDSKHRLVSQTLLCDPQQTFPRDS